MQLLLLRHEADSKLHAVLTIGFFNQNPYGNTGLSESVISLTESEIKDILKLLKGKNTTVKSEPIRNTAIRLLEGTLNVLHRYQCSGISAQPMKPVP